MWRAASLLLLVSVIEGRADTINAGVASNFAAPAAELAARFEAESGHEVRVSTASTGVLYAQILNGAPFSVLLAADAERPKLLEASGDAVAASRFTYAIGRLVLWSADPALTDADCRDQLDNLGTAKLAIANPLTAPYGAAAKQFLTRAGVWDAAQDNLVYGENIAQTLQFVATRNAQLGLIAAAHTTHSRLPEATCSWQVPADMHATIEQQALLIDNADAARAFLEFVAGSEGRAIIRAHGYEVPD